MPFFAIFIVIPLLELMVFASVGEHIGLFTTLLLALLTAIIGGAIVKYQGVQTLFALRTSVDRGEMPLDKIFDGFCLVAAGALLITPGFITDTIGFALLVPAFRSFLRHIVKNHTQWTVTSPHGGGGRARPNDPTIIEGEYENLDEDKPDKGSLR